MQKSLLRTLCVGGLVYSTMLSSPVLAAEPHSPDAHKYEASIYNNGPVVTLDHAIKKHWMPHHGYDQHKPDLMPPKAQKIRQAIGLILKSDLKQRISQAVVISAAPIRRNIR